MTYGAQRHQVHILSGGQRAIRARQDLEGLHDHVTTPNSHHLNIPEYKVLYVVNTENNQQLYNIKDWLIYLIVAEMSDLHENHLIRLYSRFRRRQFY